LLLFTFQAGSPIFAWGGPYLPMASEVAEVTGIYHHTQLMDQDRVLLTFSLGWPRTAILSISASLSSWNYRCVPLCLAPGIYWFTKTKG
jgi:hypothetical protein